MQIDLVIDDFGVHGHPYVSIQLDDGCFNTATAARSSRQAAGEIGRLRLEWRNAEIEHTHNTPGDALSR